MILNKKNHTNKSTQLAAMFGLDARIALAIFGALSVITGVALYSAIEHLKATVLLTEMQEVGKAWEAYYLDTLQELGRETATTTNPNFYSMKTKDLVTTPGIAGWKGPYLSYSVSGNYLQRSPGNINIIEVEDSTAWCGANAKRWSLAQCTSGKTCSLWIMWNMTDDNMAKNS